MSITSAKSGATGISLALDNNYMEPIATTLVGSGGVNQVTFNDIPQNYKHLQLRIFAQTNRGTYGIEELRLVFNGDVSLNYRTHTLYGDGSAAAASTNLSYHILLGDGTYGTTTGGTFGAGVVDILDYSNTSKYTTTRHLSGVDINGTIAGYGGRVGLNSGLWLDSSAVNSIKISPNNGTLLSQYSRFSLYGIKG